MDLSDEKNKRIDSIQVLRIIAALCIALYHMGGIQIDGLRLQMGVNLLYCISAFLLMYTTRNESKKKNFLLRRLIRLVPLYWMITLATFFAMQYIPSFADSQGHVGIRELVCSMFFVPYKRLGIQGDAAVVRPIVGPAWTLYWDLYFAVIFSLVMMINHRFRGWVTAAICSMLGFIGFVFDFSSNPFLSILFSPFWCNFVAGICAYEIFVRIKKDNKLKTSKLWRSLCFFSGSVFLLVAYCIISNQPITALLCMGGLLLIIIGANDHSCSSKTVYLGKLTYSFYLVHYYVIIAVGKFVDWKVLSIKTMMAAIVVLLIATCISSFAYQIVEVKLGNKIKKVLTI